MLKEVLPALVFIGINQMQVGVKGWMWQVL
jgi:hypothetical protein